jgi:hypothetical protein
MVVGLALLIGCILRLVWAEDMEYKADEAWTFERARAANCLRDVPWLGMNSSVDVPNPGMSLWVFIGLEQLSGAQDPPHLVRAVQLANCLALVLLAVFACRVVPAGEREVWLWAAALVAVNPLAVLFHRKLWPPCVLPLLTLAMLWGWFRRERRGPALTWGLVGACLGQIHMAGFFFAAGFALWALLFDRKGVAWRGWLLGSVLGALPLVPWALYLLSHPSAAPGNPHRWVHALECKFWVRWFTESFGLGIDYTLGRQFRDFLRWPLWHGRPTYLVGVAHFLIAAIALFLLGGAILRLARKHSGDNAQGKTSPTAFTVAAALGGFGLLLTLSCCSIHRHYMIVLFPLEFVWVARLALQKRCQDPFTCKRVLTPFLGGRTLLATLWVAQLLISANFLAFIHHTQYIRDEYGPTYRLQQRATEAPLTVESNASAS